MLNEPTIEKLKALKLTVMAAAWEEQQKSPAHANLAFDERLSLLVEAEWTARESARLARNLQDAKLRIPGACVEDIDYSAKRELEKGLIRQLATCRWIEEHQNVVITGAAGPGRPTSPAPSPSRPAAEASAPSAASPHASSRSSPSLTPTAPTPVC